MNRKIRPIIVASAVGAASIVGILAAPSAFAASTTCNSGAGKCSAFYTYSGGATQAKITVDYGGSSNVSTKAYFNNPDGSQNCYYAIKPSDPPKTFYCNWAKGTGKYEAYLLNYGNTFPSKVTLTHS